MSIKSITKKILVFGFYHKGNAGDNFFIDAFQTLFPDFNFQFVDHITKHHLLNIDGVFIGGGSLIGEPISLDDGVFELLKQQKIFYIGIGSETNIHLQHLQLLQIATLIAIRNKDGLEKIKQLNPHTIVIPDLVHSLVPKVSNCKIHKSILFLPNVLVMPQFDNPHWKFSAWEYFKAETAQFLDLMIEQNYYLTFFPLSTNFELNDIFAGIEINNRMQHRNSGYFITNDGSFAAITHLMSQYSLIITQRYHGIVLAEMLNLPCLAISHHHKINNSSGHNLSYYGLTKDQLKKETEKIFASLPKVSPNLPFNSNISGFEELIKKVKDALCGD